MSRLQTGAVQPALSEVPLGEVLDRVLKELSGAERVLVGPLPTAVVDPGLLEHVLANLLSNALRHSASVGSPGSGWAAGRPAGRRPRTGGPRRTGPASSNRSSGWVTRPPATGSGSAWRSREASPRHRAAASTPRTRPAGDW